MSMRRYFWMFAVALAVVWMGCARTPQPTYGPVFDQAYTHWSTVVSRHAIWQGVDYPALADDSRELTDALANMERVGRAEFDAWPEPAQLAFLINAHNAHAVARILNHWPVRSLGGTTLLRRARHVKDIRLLGREWSLAQLADEVTGERFAEPRAAFLLNWGARGCAPLPDMALTADNLNQMLARQTRRVLADRSYCRYDKRHRLIRVTRLLKTHREMFEREYGTLWVFLARYLPVEDARQIDKRPPRIRWLPFAKRLNLAPLADSPR